MIRVKTHDCELWFCTRVETFDNRNSICPATVTCDHGTNPEDTDDAPAPMNGAVRMMSPTFAAGHAMPVKLEAEPATTKAPTRLDSELIAGISEPVLLELPTEIPEFDQTVPPRIDPIEENVEATENEVIELMTLSVP